MRWRNHLSQLLNEHGVSDVRQPEIHATEPLVPELYAFEVAMANEKLQRYVVQIIRYLSHTIRID
jgi:hypothetical protein